MIKLLKFSDKVIVAGVADLCGYLRDIIIRLYQQPDGFIHAQFLNVVCDCHVSSFFENTVQVYVGKVKMLRYIAHTE